MAFTPPAAQPLSAAPVQLPATAPATMMAPPMQTQTPNLAAALAKTGGGGSSSGSGSSSLGSGSSSLGGGAGADSKGNKPGDPGYNKNDAIALNKNLADNNAGAPLNKNDKTDARNPGSGDPNRYDEAGNLKPEDAYSANKSQTAAGAQGELGQLMGAPADTGDMLGNYLDNISGSSDLFGAGASGNGTGDGWDTGGGGGGDWTTGNSYGGANDQSNINSGNGTGAGWDLTGNGDGSQGGGE